MTAARLAKPLAAPLPATAKAIRLCAATDHAAAPGVRSLGLALGLGANAMLELNLALGQPVRVRKREVLFRAGEPLTALYAIRLGTFKSLLLAEDGREQVVGYHMAADVLGLDAVGQHSHVSEAIALEDSEVCALAFAKLDELAYREPSLRFALLRLMSRAAHLNQEMMLMLGSMRSEERLATFLLALAERFRRAGYSASEFMLRMTREEIASYLGLQLETVSRLFSRLHEHGLIQVQGRAVKLLDLPALKALAGHGP